MKNVFRTSAKYLALPLILLAAYALITTMLSFVYFPSPLAIWEALISWLSSRWDIDVLPSIRNLLVGYAIGCALGATLGIVLGLNRTLREIIEPIATFVRSIPPIALVPIFILALGLADSMRISVIATGAFFPVLVNAIDGAAGVDPVLRDVAKTQRLKRRFIIGSIVIPSALPQILAGMKTALTISIILIFTSELIGATDGIGAFILQSERFFAIPALWAGTLLLGLLGFVLSRLFDLVESRALSWRHDNWKNS